MYSETFFTQCSFDPNGLILCGQTVRSIAWGTVESGSSDALADVINALSEGPPRFISLRTLFRRSWMPDRICSPPQPRSRRKNRS